MCSATAKGCSFLFAVHLSEESSMCCRKCCMQALCARSNYKSIEERRRKHAHAQREKQTSLDPFIFILAIIHLFEHNDNANREKVLPKNAKYVLPILEIRRGSGERELDQKVIRAHSRVSKRSECIKSEKPCGRGSL